jgi:hypothetical protein
MFVRLDEISELEDIVNRGIPAPEEIVRRNAQPPPVKISDAAQFVELLQILLYVKGISTLHKTNLPKLCVLLSCWDTLGVDDGTIPEKLLEERVPLLHDFVKNNWASESFSILGLSSTERTLSDEPDEEYIDKTPISFGYFVMPSGIEERDLTLLISNFIGK